MLLQELTFEVGPISEVVCLVLLLELWVRFEEVGSELLGQLVRFWIQSRMACLIVVVILIAIVVSALVLSIVAAVVVALNMDNEDSQIYVN